MSCTSSGCGSRRRWGYVFSTGGARYSSWGCSGGRDELLWRSQQDLPTASVSAQSVSINQIVHLQHSRYYSGRKDTGVVGKTRSCDHDYTWFCHALSGWLMASRDNNGTKARLEHHTFNSLPWELSWLVSFVSTSLCLVVVSPLDPHPPTGRDSSQQSRRDEIRQSQ